MAKLNIAGQPKNPGSPPSGPAYSTLHCLPENLENADLFKAQLSLAQNDGIALVLPMDGHSQAYLINNLVKQI